MTDNDVMNIAKKRGFIWSSFEIYSGVAGFFDYGPLGAILKNNIINKWRSYYVVREGFYEIESPTIMSSSPSDPLSVPKTVHKMKLAGFTAEEIHMVSHSNAAEFYGI